MANNTTKANTPGVNAFTFTVANKTEREALQNGAFFNSINLAVPGKETGLGMSADGIRNFWFYSANKMVTGKTFKFEGATLAQALEANGLEIYLKPIPVLDSYGNPTGATESKECLRPLTEL